MVIFQKTIPNVVAVANVFLLLAGTSFSAAATLPFEADFESVEGFAPGILVSDPDWNFDPNQLTAEIINTDSVSGTQSMLLDGSGKFILSPVDALAGGIRWVDFYVKPVFVSETDLTFSIGSYQSAVTGFVVDSNYGQVYAVDGDGQGSGVWVSAEVPITLVGASSLDWVRLAYRIDYVNKRWDLYIDNRMVLANLGFLDDDFTQLSNFAISTDETDATGFDHFYVGDTSQVDLDGDGLADVDADNDGIADFYEFANGMSASMDDREDDSDNDSVSNIEEFISGLLAGAADSDGDGVHDGQELRLGNDPVIADSYSLNSIPFTADFEAAALGSIDGVNLWAVESGSATVQTAEVASGAQAVELAATTEDAVLRNNFNGSAYAEVWIDFQIKPVFWGTGDGPDVADFLYAPLGVFYFNEGNKITYLNGDGQGGGTWGTTAVTLDNAQWQRVTLYNDYVSQTWSLWLNGVRVAQDIGFAHPQPYFNHLAFQQGGEVSSFIDDLTATPTEPAALDNDGDTLSNDFERINSTYGFDPENSIDAAIDTDNDGLGAAEELALGLGFTSSDSDGDGVHDGQEIRLGNLADVADSYSLSSIPFAADFEAAALGSIDGVNLWSVESGSATVQIAEVASGAQAVELAATTEDAVLSNNFDGSAFTQVWVDFQIKPVFWGSDDGPDVREFLYAPLGVFYFNQNEQVTYLNGDGQGSGTWETVAVTLDSSQWQRVTLYNDYTAQTWSLWLNGVRVAQNIGFAHPQPYFNHLAFQQGDEASAYLDDLTAAISEPPTLDNDGDTLTNDFERTNSNHGFDLDNAADGDLDVDGDGLGTAQELVLGTMFDVSDSDADGLLDGSEIFHGEDPMVFGTYNALIDGNGSGIYTWMTDFEVVDSYAVGPLDGQDLWRANIVEASVSTAASQSGAQALALSSAGTEPVIVEQILVTPESETTVWVSFQAQLNSGELPELFDPATLGAFIMSRNPAGNLVVLDGSDLSWIDTGLTLADATWVRFDCRLDYTAKTWDLYVDYVLTQDDVSFVNPNLPVFSAIQFEQDQAHEATNVAYIDALRISTAMPDVLNSNWGNVPDAWKQLIVDADLNDVITDISQVLSSDDFDGDGDDNITEYFQGRLATVSDADVNIYADASIGDNLYSGFSAVPAVPNVSDGPKLTIASAITVANDSSIILLQSGNYDETILSLDGKDLTLRLNGPVSIR